MTYLSKLMLFCILLTAFSTVTKAQAPKKLDAAEIKQALNKLEVLGSVLYLAAHPDDENTRLIAYMANEKNMRTAYLAMTRGDGGQNLIGTEIREYLGIIRTQELLAARRRDGGEQFFTRANDFGFSKDPNETLNVWDKDDALADVVWNIRRFRPDIIITRFDTTLVPSGSMHGHHTASARLAMQAFDLANDPTKYPEQLKYVEPWQPKTLYWNGYNFGGRNDGEEFDGTPGYITVDFGAYNPLLGLSYDEISSLGRSEHKSQGFGSTGRRGESKEVLMYWKGEKPKSDLFEGIDSSWSRVKGGAEIGALLAKANKNYNLSNPSIIIDDLLQAREKLVNIDNDYWKKVKLEELDLVIKSVLGLYLEVVADEETKVSGEKLRISVEAINRSDVKVSLNSIEFPELNEKAAITQPLANNQSFRKNLEFTLPELTNSQPYWLREDGTIGMYRVDDQALIGLAQNPDLLNARFNLTINEKPFTYSSSVVYKENDRVDGEVYRPFVITPPVFVNIAESVLVFADNSTKEVNVVVKAGTDNVSGKVSLDLPSGWKSSPEHFDYNLKGKQEEARFKFQVLPPTTQQEGQVTAKVTYNGKSYHQGLKTIEYKHIPKQTIFPESTAKVVRLNLERKGQYVGYIMGSGDAVPESLTQIGYTVSILDPNSVTAESLAAFDAVIIGVRAYNTVERMPFIQPDLMEYVKQGGTVIAQYNTSMRDQPEIGPYPFQISRDRVTVEDAKVRILAPDHPLINGPNKITEKDFEGWVQERGLYFPNQWDEKYTAILSSNDPGDKPNDGGLIVGQYGEGYFVYTGYSWFRELPAGVAGAYRIFSNMISLGNEKPKNTKLNQIEKKR
ncbi:PIG-L family deacetylase [Roseivirga sp.]|uniref:PIG-L family deacetylase n=1 Tax=Roseivirga sp. TaxID=1964215 RepID=UPI002B26D10C|nr:PIG-L family deacetylase [Roseivirga sp.]